MRTIRENIRAGALRACIPFRAKLSLLLHPGGQYDSMPFIYRWRWRISRALMHGWAWVRSHEFK